MNVQNQPKGSRERTLDEVKAEFMKRAGKLNPFEDIKRKDFGIKVPLDDKRVARPGFVVDVLDGFRAAAPFMEFLCEAIGLRF